ncbi:zinc-binding alcohol dehydrogenase family protein [Roseibium sp.]|uniref:zinc-binding alcohol dehydrogenase family protein n=1 Tax=Roseibium sp. TaxID=1936156 RepID=UPI003A96E743
MKAVAYQIPGTIDREDSLQDITLDTPVPTGHDLLVEVRAVSVNPVDTKVRSKAAAEDGGWKILGWDAAGIVSAVGDQVTGFKPGDEVWYAGSILRQGTNSEFHLVDERIVGRKPTSASFAEAAALPLTSLTAWEMLFDRLRVTAPVPGADNAVLIIGGAGGVGSIAIQLLREKTDLTVIATASRPETVAWVKELGAHHVIDHHKPFGEQLKALGLGAPAFVFSTNATQYHAEQIADVIAPQGRFGLIDDPESVAIGLFKSKSVSIHWELMYTRSIFQTPDMDEQGKILNEVSGLIDAKKIRTTLTDVMGPINAATLRKAHGLIESNTARGKIVLEGF